MRLAPFSICNIQYFPVLQQTRSQITTTEHRVEGADSDTVDCNWVLCFYVYF